jgi:hypothetical protein
MTVSSTRGLASWKVELWRPCLAQLAQVLLACLLLVGLAPAAELTALRTERSDDGIHLTANVRFELPPAIEEALLKGIPLIFVAEAEIYRDRWYWTDKRVASAARSLRLAYQPLTRRWRVSQGIDGNTSARVTLAQNYDTLPEALGAIERISQWKIAEPADVDANGHWLLFRFRLDISALPRPFQIGIAGQREWQIALERSQRLRLDKRAPEPQPAEK